MTTTEQERQIEEARVQIKVTAKKAMMGGTPAKAVIEALRNEADRLEGKV